MNKLPVAPIPIAPNVVPGMMELWLFHAKAMHCREFKITKHDEEAIANFIHHQWRFLWHAIAGAIQRDAETLEADQWREYVVKRVKDQMEQAHDE